MRGIHKQHPHITNCWPDAFIRHYPGGDKPWALPPADAANLGWRLNRAAECAAAVAGLTRPPQPRRHPRQHRAPASTE